VALKTAICYNLNVNQQFFFVAAMSFVVLAAYTVMLGLQKKPWATVISVFLPMIFMLAIANDTGRWLELSVMNAWLLAAAFQEMDSEAAPVSPRTQMAGAIGLVVLLAMGSSQVNEVSRFTRNLAVKLGMATPGLPHEWMDKCDPTWRELVAPTPPARKN
jgi:hypothetical protein